MSPPAPEGPPPPPAPPRASLRFAVVIPFLEEILGNRAALAIAAELGRSHDVRIFTWSATPESLETARRLTPGVPVRSVHTRPPRPRRMSRFLVGQFRRGLDRQLSAALLQAHGERPFDHILVCGNEGHWVAEYVRRWRRGSNAHPRVSVLLFDLVDGVYLLRHRRSHPVAREGLVAVHAAMHWSERERLRSFDFRFVISQWTAVLVEALYGWSPDGILACVDTRTFTLPGPGTRQPAPPFLALPTASLSPSDVEVVRRLRADGVPLVAYGPRPVPGIDYRGFLPEAEMVRLLQSAAATLFLFDYEALGLIPFESLACGTPVITRPEQGPGLELRGIPEVHFFRSYEELLAVCRKLLDTPRTEPRALGCWESVQGYAPDRAVASLLDVLEPPRSSSRPDPVPPPRA